MVQNMTSCWKVTVIGGNSNGSDYTFPADGEILVGRTHAAGLRLTEEDVSGKHVNLFVREDGVACVRNLSRHRGATKVNGEVLGQDEVIPIAPKDYVWLGKKVRIRFDAVPMPHEERLSTGAASFTGATQWMAEGDVGTATAEIEDEDSASAPVAVPSGTFATRPVDGTFVDGTSATRPMEGTFATGPTNGTFVAPSGSGTFATRVPDAFSASGTAVSDDGSETIAPGMVGDGEDVPSGTVVGDETRVMNGGARPDDTKMLPKEMFDQYIIRKREEEERRAKIRKLIIGIGFAVYACILGGLWYFTRPSFKDGDFVFPVGHDGKPDVARYALFDSHGVKLIEVDYPRNDRMSVTVSPESNGVSVVTYMGRKRDVPFFLQLETIVRSDELEKSLMQSVAAWFSRTEALDSGFVFDERMKAELRPQFFEDAHRGCCQSRSLHGVRFLSFDYKRTWPDGELWHGVAIYFRRGDAVYLHRREIPEFYWAKGGESIAVLDPNIAIYTAFIESYWESPGVEELPIDRPVPELMASIRDALKKERASDWRFVKKDIDAVLARTWQTDPKTRDLAESCLKRFREVLSTYYWSKFNAFDTARENRDEKRMRRIIQDVKMVFDNPDERYYSLINNGEVW